MAAPARPESAAVASLMDSARAQVSAGRLANAAATLERALRIEPKNPRLWHQLALIRLQQGDYTQAGSLAARSNTWAADDAELKAANQRVIEEARAAKR
jgi:Flp pilus assembly protein TadD